MGWSLWRHVTASSEFPTGNWPEPSYRVGPQKHIHAVGRSWPQELGPVRHQLISAHPDSCGCEFDECEIVGGVLLVAGRDGSEVLELVEEALDAVPRSVQEGAEGGFVEPAGQRLDVGEDAPCRHVLAEKVAVVGAVGDQDLAGAEALKHVGGAPAVVSLSLGQLQGDRQAVGIDEGVDLGGQPASRAPHAAGVRSVPSRGVLRTPFLPFAPCW